MDTKQTLKVDYTTFSDTFNAKYRAKNFANTDSDTDTNAHSHMVACISNEMSYLPLGIQVAAYAKHFKC